MPGTTVRRPAAAAAAEALEVAVVVARGAMVETVDLVVVRVGFAHRHPHWRKEPRSCYSCQQHVHLSAIFSLQVALVTSTTAMAMEETTPRWTGGETKMRFFLHLFTPPSPHDYGGSPCKLTEWKPHVP